MKVAWLAPYPIEKIENLELDTKVSSHPASWIVVLANYLSKKSEVELHIITETPRFKRNKYVFSNNIHFHIIKSGIPFTTKGFPSIFPFHILSDFYFNSRKINKELRRIKPDIIHAHGTETCYAIAALKSKFPHVISIQGIISEIHKLNPSFRSWWVKRIEKKVIKNGKYFGCRTNWDKNFVHNINPKAEIFYLPEAIDNIFFEKKWINNQEKKILYIGSLIRPKGIELLIRSLSKLLEKIPEITLTIVGDGPIKFKTELQGLINLSGVTNNIKFLGRLEPDEIALLLSNHSVFVLPSMIENSPNTLAEAMAIGTPCVARNVGGIPSMIDDGVDGMLAMENNENELADKISFLLNNGKKVIEISNNARKKARKRNHPLKVTEITINSYNKIINDSTKK